MHTSNLEFELKCGVKVQIVSILIDRTYSGLIGYPTKRINESIINNDSRYPKEKWGLRKELFLWPSSEELNTILKPFCYNVWLQSEILAKDGNYDDGSQLIVSFFADSFENLGMIEFLKQELETLDWQNEAINFDY